nr:triple gene block protein 3 [Carrot virus S]
MFQIERTQVIIVASSFIVALVFLSCVFNTPSSPCLVTITGESIRISGCTFDETFSEYAKTLTIPNHWVD